MFVSLLTKEYGSGRVAITADRLGGYRTSTGQGDKDFWKKLLKWTGKKMPNETVHIGIIKSVETNYQSFLSTINSITFQRITLGYLSIFGPNNFDVIYFIGLPPSHSSNMPSILEEYVRNGGGLIFESPNVSGEISLLEEIDTITIASSNRPLYEKSYWTLNGVSSDIYTPEYFSPFMTTIEESSVPTGWNILLSDIQTIEEVIEEENDYTFEYDNFATTEFGIGFSISMKNGLVTIEEGENEIFSSSSSSSSSSIIETEWDVCDNIISYWKLNENYNTSFIWNSNGDIALIGKMREDGVEIPTNQCSEYGVINRAILFKTYLKNNITTFATKKINFVSDGVDTAFSIALWVNPHNAVVNSCILDKQNVWDVFILNGFVRVRLKNDTNTRMLMSSSKLSYDSWNFLVITYDTINLKIYIKNQDVSGTQIDAGYTSMANANSPFYIGSSNSGEWFYGRMDNILILDKKINSVEMEGMYNMGRGTEECWSILKYTSSSESSSSSIDSSSSSLGYSTSSESVNNTTSSSSSSSSSSSESIDNTTSSSSESIGNTTSSSSSSSI